jgi:iron(III) transport system ATP-binding protein
MRDEVERVLRDSHTTAIFVTHDQQEAFVLADRVAVMHAGRIQQLDAPEDIYHHPMSQFVAEFVGAVDFLPGVVTARGIETELGVFPNVEALDAGADVEVMLRPDDVAFTPDADGQGVIARRDFLGSETIYVIELGSGRRVHSSQSSASAIPAGTRVRAHAEVLHVVTFPALAPRA